MNEHDGMLLQEYLRSVSERTQVLDQLADALPGGQNRELCQTLRYTEQVQAEKLEKFLEPEA